MFQFTRFPPRRLCIQRRVMEYCSIGFPHSDTSGSTLLCSSPERFAAYASFFGNLSLGIHHAPIIAFVKQLLSSARFFKSHYATFKELGSRRLDFSVQRQEKMIPGLFLKVKGPGGFSANFLEKSGEMRRLRFKARQKNRKRRRSPRPRSSGARTGRTLETRIRGAPRSLSPIPGRPSPSALVCPKP